MEIIGPGKSYFAGKSADESIKLDVYYTDPFIRPVLETDGIRLAEIDDIVAMKIDVVSRGGRKKDFWDIDELLSAYSIEKMLQLHKERYPYTHNEKEILSNFRNFEDADAEEIPLMLKSDNWDNIKNFIIGILFIFKHQ